MQMSKNKSAISYSCAQVEKRLARRLQAGITAWTKCLQGDDKRDSDDTMDTDTPEKTKHKPGGEPQIKVWYR